MEVNNNSVWQYYNKGHVHPEFVPYLRKIEKDQWGNDVNINTWEKQGGPEMVDPQLVRINKGMTFQKMWESDPCPPGWKKAPPHADGKPSAYCERDDLPFQPVLYTDKGFIAKKQNFDGYTTPNRHPQKVTNSRADNQPKLNMNYNELKPLPVSTSFDMRSINPFDGKYTTYFNTKMHNKERYVNPNSVDGLRGEWYKDRESNYSLSPTSDSYL